MTTKKMLQTAGALLPGALAFVFLGCPNPASPATTSNHTVSGVVADAVTGAGISGAKVILGKYAATTDSQGKYTITLAAGESTVSGDFSVSKGTDYQFFFFQGTSLDASSNPSGVNMMLAPVNSPTTGVTVTGKVEDSAGNELSNVSSVSLTIVNENAGYSSLSSSYTTGTGYSVQTPTVGSKCLVVVTITYTDSTPSQTFYKTDVDLSTSAPTLDLTVPAVSDSTEVAVSDAIVTTSTAMSAIKCDLVVPGYGAVPLGR